MSFKKDCDWSEGMVEHVIFSILQCLKAGNVCCVGLSLGYLNKKKQMKEVLLVLFCFVFII